MACVCVCKPLLPTFPPDQDGDRKLVFISSLPPLAQVKGHICHIHLPINCHCCDPAATLHCPDAQNPSFHTLLQRIYNFNISMTDTHGCIGLVTYSTKPETCFVVCKCIEGVQKSLNNFPTTDKFLTQPFSWKTGVNQVVFHFFLALSASLFLNVCQ